MDLVLKILQHSKANIERAKNARIPTRLSRDRNVSFTDSEIVSGWLGMGVMERLGSSGR